MVVGIYLDAVLFACVVGSECERVVAVYQRAAIGQCGGDPVRPRLSKVDHSATVATHSRTM